MAGERIIEALEVSVQDQALQQAFEESGLQGKEAPPPRNPLFSMYGGVGPQEYVLKVVRTIPAANLHDALLVLPFGKVIQLIEHIDYWAHKVRRSLFSLCWTSLLINWVATGMANHSHFTSPFLPPSNPPLSNRCHSSHEEHNGFAQTPPPRSSQAIQGSSHSSGYFSMTQRLIPPSPLQDTVGYNLAALRYVHRQYEAAKTAEFYEQDGGMADEEKVRAKIEAGIKKRKRAALK